MLESQGHEVIAVEWANAAFEPLSNRVFDIAFMGRGDNIFQPPHVLAWIIRATFPEIAIVLMTGRGQATPERNPFDHVLFKPFSIEQIQQVIAVSLPRRDITTPGDRSPGDAMPSATVKPLRTPC